MPGARYRPYRLGDRAELLVEQLLSAFAFTTRVPRQEDIGFDFFCSLITNGKEEQLLKAGPFFTVQAKSSTDPVVYEKDHEIAWITSQENPLLLCVADRSALAMNVYSTWNVMCGPLYRKPSSITLLPSVGRDSWPGVDYKEDGSQHIRLGVPIVRVTDADIFDDSRVDQITTVIRDWVALDRTNIVNRQAGMFWVTGPLSYETGRSPYASGQLGTSIYWHPANVPQCVRNLSRAITALALIIRDHLSEAEKGQPPWAERVAALQEVVRTHWDLFDEHMRGFLINQGWGPRND